MDRAGRFLQARHMGAHSPAARVAVRTLTPRWIATSPFSRADVRPELPPAAAAATVVTPSPKRAASDVSTPSKPAPLPIIPPKPQLFKKVLAGNRGEIAIRILRAASELAIPTVSMYSYEDRYSPHRFKADESFMIGRGLSPVAAYLSIPEIVRMAKENGVQAIHPGYGFLSENADFAEACARAGLVFIGPPPDVLRTFGDKTAARALAQSIGVPTVPGTPGAVRSVDEARAFVDTHGLPVIIKAAHGGGGRGMRVVKTHEELEESFNRASSEAKAAFGNGDVFVERYVESPRHIEIQILADKAGNVVHLYERDCSVQRRHQKVVEMAPALDLKPEIRQRLTSDAVRLCKAAKYVNAGTVEFLLDTATGETYFMEVNPRIQVEHTVTEEVTGIDIVQTQMRIAAGMTLPEMGLLQDRIHVSGVAVQCRITTEDPSRNFTPDSGILSVYRSATGNGIRLDDGPGYPGAPITPHYDSLLVKVTAHAHTFEDAVSKLTRALREHRIRGVSTNIPFLLNVLQHPAFRTGAVTTRFIEMYPEVLRARQEAQNRGEKLLRYLSNVAVNGPDPSLGASGPPPSITVPTIPKLPLATSAAPKGAAVSNDGGSAHKRGALPTPPYLRNIFVKQGPHAFAKAVRAHKHTLITDTTWRDAHQSLLATRVRTRDLLAIAPATQEALAAAYSLEMWGGATFDVALRFLRECPWDRLDALREAIPHIPFQMLFRGANAVGYTSYPDNAVAKFCDVAVRHGMDVFRIFDSLNYLPNMQLGIEAVGAAGGVVEAAICYTGDVHSGELGARGRDYKYKLDYYLSLARSFKEAGAHVLAVKDMAGLLTPQSATLLLEALRREFPDVPLHVHTHDTAGTGVASMVAAVNAGADVVDVAIDAMSGTTSQPSMGALVASLARTDKATELDLKSLAAVNEYWDEARNLYAPFESGQLTGSSDIYENEIPGGQYTNLLFQSKQLGLSGQFGAIKRAYAAANRVLGDIVKVTPSSKVVGDLAQFMVANKLSEAQVLAQAGSLSFPQSIIEYLQGYLGIPPGGFPEPFRSAVLKDRKLPNGNECFEGRPGAEMPPVDFLKVERSLKEAYGEQIVREVDVVSYVIYSKVFDEWMKYCSVYGDVSVIPTKYFTQPLAIGEEISFEIERGKTLYIRLKSIGEVDDAGHRDVVWEMNGENRVIRVADASAGGKIKTRNKAEKSDPSQVGAPMPGVVVDVRVAVGKTVARGDPIAVLSAMKMETIIAAPKAGTVKLVAVAVGETLEAGDLVVVVE